MTGHEVIMLEEKSTGEMTMKRAGRKILIVDVLVERSVRGKGASTMTMIARRLGLSPSTHLMEMLKDLWIEERIELDLRPNPRMKSKNVYWWYVISSETQELLPSSKCSTPWDCPSGQSSDKCIIDGAICPEQIYLQER